MFWAVGIPSSLKISDVVLKLDSIEYNGVQALYWKMKCNWLSCLHANSVRRRQGNQPLVNADDHPLSDPFKLTPPSFLPEYQVDILVAVRPTPLQTDPKPYHMPMPIDMPQNRLPAKLVIRASQHLNSCKQQITAWLRQDPLELARNIERDIPEIDADGEGHTLWWTRTF